MPNGQATFDPNAPYQPAPASSSAGSAAAFDPNGAYAPAGQQDTSTSQTPPAQPSVMSRIVSAPTSSRQPSGSVATHVYDPQTATISAAPKTSALGVAEQVAQIPTDPIGVASHALNSIVDAVSNYTPEGRAEHPVLSRIGDVANSARELLTGGQSAGKPIGTKSGVLDNPVTTAISLAPGGAEAAEIGTTKLASAIDSMQAARAAKAAEAADAVQAANAGRVTELEPRSLTYRELTPAPQHGTPVKVASPLDRPTIDRLAGGKDLSPEAAQELQNYARATSVQPGQEIEVGSTSKNTLHKLSEPVQKALTDTGLKMNKVMQNAQPFKSSIVDDGALSPAMDAVRDNFPGADEEKLNAAVDKEIQSADDALRSKDPNEVLAYRRKLGTQIDWNNIAKNPQSPGEAQNVARVKLYNAMRDKLRTEIPDVAALDKAYEKNLELQRFLDKNGVDRDPVLANAEHQSELTKGKTQIENEAHNAIVKRNRDIAIKVLQGLGISAGTIVGGSLLHDLATGGE